MLETWPQVWRNELVQNLEYRCFFFFSDPCSAFPRWSPCLKTPSWFLKLQAINTAVLFISYAHLSSNVTRACAAGVAVFCEVNVYMQIYYFAFLPSCVRLPLVVECWGQWDVGYCQSYSKAYGIGELSFDKKSNVPLQDLGSFSVWCAKLMRTCREPREKHLWAYYKILWTFLRFCFISLSACYGFYKRWKSSNDIGRNRKLFYIPSDAMKNLLAQARTSLLGLPFQ